jgi:membrane protease YdiL (CAAX protease family)
VVTLLVGAAVLGWTLRLPAGSDAFVPAAFVLAAVWAAGAFASGPLHLGRARTRSGHTPVRPIVQPIVLGLVLLGVFLAGGLAVGTVPALRRPVDELLDHAQVGSLALVTVVTVVNGIAEELFFRGALFAAITGVRAVVITTFAYALITVGSGIPLLVFAAAVLGFVTALQRRVTGGVLAPILTHLTWSVGMLLLLPSALELV